MNFSPWERTHKGDARGRVLADNHYTRQSPGHPMWTRPGYNFVLYAEDLIDGRAVFVWWRPKWEAGQERRDKLRAIECTIFRKEGCWTLIASELIKAAVWALWMPEAATDLNLACPHEYQLITGVSTAKTSRGRGKNSAAGKCFRSAGFREFEHRSGKADVWLEIPANEMKLLDLLGLE